MPATFILTTADTALESVWKRQLPRPPVAFARPAELHKELLRPGARVWIADVSDPRSRYTAGTGTLVILVGEPHSIPFEQARQNHAARLYLSYEESRVNLGEAVSLLEEIADKNAQLQVLMERNRRLEGLIQREPVPAPEAIESWDFLESALEHLGTRDRLLDEFRRAGRYVVKAGKVLFFFRQGNVFVSDRESHECDATHPFPLWLEDHPATLDPAQWEGCEDPAVDASVLQLLQSWGVRLLVPLHTHGTLAGWMGLGPRADGTIYREADKARSVLLGRLLERCLERLAQIEEYQRNEKIAGLVGKYLPGARILSREEINSAELPVEVRAIAGEALHYQKVVTQPAQPPFHYRIAAGPVPEIEGVWVLWEEAAPEIDRVMREMEKNRRELFRSLGLTLSHELANPLVSLVTFAHLIERNTNPPIPNGGPGGSVPASSASVNLAREVALTGEIAKLQLVTEHAAILAQLAEPSRQSTDVGKLVSTLATARGFATRISDQPTVFFADAELLRFAFTAIFDAVSANRLEQAAKNLIVSVQMRGQDNDRIAIISIEGKQLELDGILPFPTPNAPPNHGRLSVFIAREILRMHGGNLQAGPGIKGTDIQISVGPLRV